MSIKVAILVSAPNSQIDWAKFSDETLSKDLDWNLVSVSPCDRRAVIEYTTEQRVENHKCAIWTYDVSPLMLIDDLLLALRQIAHMGFPVSVVNSETIVQSDVATYPVHFCYDVNSDQWELNLSPRELLTFWQKSQVATYL